VLRSPPATRAWQAIAYLLFAAAGAAAFIWPIPVVRATAGSATIAGIWVCFLVIGGLTAATGRALGQWPGEYVGLPPIAAATAIYGLSILTATTAVGFCRSPYASVPFGLALVAMTALVVGRWVEVNRTRQEALRQAKQARGDVLIGRHRPNGGR